jgi:hypothetical protein
MLALSVEKILSEELLHEIFFFTKKEQDQPGLEKAVV